MKYKIITSLACLLLIFFAGAQEKWLPVRQVVEKFLTTYDIHSLPYAMVDFEKRNGDWYIKTIDMVKGEIIRSKPELFYSARQKRFLPLKIEGNTSAEPVDYTRSVPESEVYNFDIQPFYGYPGWYKDVIKEYGNRPTLTEIELNALARAYSSQAISPVTDQGSDAVEKDRYKMSFKRDAFSARQLQQFTASIDSAIEKYRQLSLRKPGFQTRVGDATDKYANEIMFKYHILLTFSEKGSGEMVIPKNIYKDSTLKVARSYLNACPQQGIFVSLGDNDFYPLFYVQHVEGRRKDVYLVNYNLMAVDRFIYRMTHPQFDSRPITLSVDTSEYAGKKNEIIFLAEKTEPVPVSELINVLRFGKEEDGRKTFMASAIELPWKKEGKISTKVSVALPKNAYILKNHWVLLDIINNLDGRVICFPADFTDELKGLNTYLTFKPGNPVYMYNN